MTVKLNKISMTVLIVCISAVMPLFAQTARQFKPGAEAANRRTALICLEQSNEAKKQGHWVDVYEKSSLGVAYDGNIPDLWLLRAEAAAEFISKITPNVPGKEEAIAEQTKLVKLPESAN